MDTAHIPDRQALTTDVTTDVCIIGAGIAGLTTAYLLAKEGTKVLVLADRGVGAGETERTTAHLANALDDRYVELEKIHGIEKAALAAGSHTAAINQIETIVRSEKIDCAFERLNGYLFVPEGESNDILHRELAAAHRAGLTDVTIETRVPPNTFDMGVHLQFPDQGQFHPLLYLKGLADAVEKMGGIIHTNTHVDSVKGGETAVIKTANGHTVTAASVVVATNAPINDNATIYTRQAPYRTYVVGLKIPKKTLQKALYWDTQDPYHYVRVDDSQKNHDVLIVGGEDHKTGQANDAGLRYQRLETWARKRFPAATKVLYHWSGQVLETVDGLAMIGRKPLDTDNVYIITGDSGMGMTHGTIGGMLIRDLILGTENPWADLYDPGRKTIGDLKEFVKENANVAGEYADWLRPGKHDDVPMKTETGMVVRRGTKRIAVYCDAFGKKNELSAVCPHKGCIVHWNSGEKSWDCPCHGSRFDRYGTVVNGPSSRNLVMIEAD
ncbi:MAG: puuB [Candidatus Peribacteria bacterium]|nr:puuB [Candidatus Peribacteria bacterium]